MEKDLHNIIIRPILSEKSTQLRDASNIYCLQVATNATKSDIKEALKKIYNVSMIKCSLVNVQGKKKRRRFIEGRTNNWKKAYVRLKEGDKLDIGI